MQMEYYFPASVAEAITLMQQYGEQARLIAGGTDLLLDIERQRYHAQALVDVTRIPALQRMELDGGGVTIGAAVTYSRLLAWSAFCEGVPLLADAIRRIGSVQIRNVATLVGNITNASPAGDALPPLYVLGAQVHVDGPQGRRLVPIEKFVLGVRRIALEPGELVTHVTFHLPGPGWCGAFGKVGLRRAMIITVANVAVLLLAEGGRMAEVRIALGAVAPTVLRVPEVETFLAGSTLDEETVVQAGRLATQAVQPIDDVRASASYRREVAGGLVRRTLRELRSQVAKEG